MNVVQCGNSYNQHVEIMASHAEAIWSPSSSNEVILGHLSNLDVAIICQAIVPYLERLTDLVNLSHSSKFFRSIIFSERTSSTWSCGPLDICVDSSCRFGCGRVSIKPDLAWSILNLTSVMSVRLHMPFRMVGLLFESILGNHLQLLKRLHLRFCIDDDAAVDLSRLSLKQSNRPVNLTHLTIYGFPNTFAAAGCLDLLLPMFGKQLESLQFMETSPVGVLKTLQTNVCPSLSYLCIQGEQQVDDLWGFESRTLRYLSLHDTAIKLGINGTHIHDTLRFPFLVRLELIDRADMTNPLWATEDDIREGISTFPLSLKEVELRIDSRLANTAIVELSRRLSNLEALSLQLPDKDEEGPDDISFSTIAALKHGCPFLLSLEITDGLIGFEIDAFVALKDLAHLKRIKLLYDDNIVDSLPRLLDESVYDSIEDVQFFENAGEIFGQEDGAACWHAMEERLVKLSAVFTCVNIGLSDCWWT